jgi:hypothetical protein
MSLALREDISRLTGIILALAVVLAVSAVAQEPASEPLFKLQDVMIPVRDGAKMMGTA